MKRIRCAIYTRKSSEEGLEQDFNSLDAQYAACSAYIASQTSEGWHLIDQRYDDGGISGATLKRPGVKRLLDDIKASRIDVVVVYKVDRLTRSLLDFAKLVEAFDAANASFVSVTQSFNTTTSMGRLTLNMLLSFAQFEREVTAERIRDKLAASKARGMWMGGRPPIGYKADKRSLAIVEEHADMIRLIFKLYLALGNVRLLEEQLKRRRIHKPTRHTLDGRQFGGTEFKRGELYAILSNPIYIGKIRHHEVIYNGLHPAIIDVEQWHSVQAQLVDNRTGDRRRRTVSHPSLLAGKLFDTSGEPIIATHTNKGTRRYRYYVSRNLHLGVGSQNVATPANGRSLRIPATEIEQIVLKQVCSTFSDPEKLCDLLDRAGPDQALNATAIIEARRIASLLKSSDLHDVAVMLGKLIRQVVIDAKAVTIEIEASALASNLGIDRPADERLIEIEVPVALKRSGIAMRLVLPNGQSANSKPDAALIAILARANAWWSELLANPALHVDDLAKRHDVNPSWVSRTLRLAFLDPAIVEKVFAGTAPAHLSFEALRRPEYVPALWSAQRDLHYA